MNLRGGTASLIETNGIRRLPSLPSPAGSIPKPGVDGIRGRVAGARHILPDPIFVGSEAVVDGPVRSGRGRALNQSRRSTTTCSTSDIVLTVVALGSGSVEQLH